MKQALAAPPARPPALAEVRLGALRRMTGTYPKWMDWADYQQARRFRWIIGRAGKLAKRRKFDDRWWADGSALLRDLRILEADVSHPRSKPCPPLTLTAS
jgi:hypothetical protein